MPVSRLQLSTWARFKIKASYSRAPIQNIIASVLSGQYAYSNGLESITQATGSFSAGLAGLEPNGGDNPNAPSAYLNYILFNSSYARVAAGAVQVPQAVGFEEPQRGSGYTATNLLKFEKAIQVSQAGYLYIFVSNESENTEVWFDDLNVIHQKTLVAEATDYGVWGDVMREQKWEDLEGKYKYGYQGKYAEKDDETGWSHFEAREYDPVIGRWTTPDSEKQFYSSYLAMANDPVLRTDPDGKIVPFLVPLIYQGLRWGVTEFVKGAATEYSKQVLASVIAQAIRDNKVDIEKALWTDIDGWDVAVNGFSNIVSSKLPNKFLVKFSTEMLKHLAEASIDHDKNIFDGSKDMKQFFLEVTFKSLGALTTGGEDLFKEFFGAEQGPAIFKVISAMAENSSEYLEKASEPIKKIDIEKNKVVEKKVKNK